MCAHALAWAVGRVPLGGSTAQQAWREASACAHTRTGSLAIFGSKPGRGTELARSGGASSSNESFHALRSPM